MIFTDELRKKYHLGRYLRIKQMLNQRDSLLDIGAGKPFECMEDGSFLKYLGYGIGLDKKSCSSDFIFIKGDLINLPIKDNTFDTVVCMETLEHVDPSKIDLAFQNIHRILKKNGVFMVSTPNNKILWNFFWFFWQRTIGKMWEKSHKSEFSTREWINLLKKYFKIIDIQNYLSVILIVKMKKR